MTTPKKMIMKSLVAYEAIRDKILLGEKLPGTRLILSELETELGIGRVPIREALMRLDRSGLVKNIPYKGAVVASPPTRKEIESIYEIRIDLEVKLAVEAMNHLTKKDFTELDRLNQEMKRTTDGFYGLDRQFHATIYEASNLPHLCDIAQKLVLPVEVFLNINLQEDSVYELFNSQHQDIFDSLLEKDLERLKDVLSANINSGLKFVEKTLDQTRRFNN